MQSRCFDRFPDQVNIDGFQLKHFGRCFGKAPESRFIQHQHIVPRRRSAQRKRGNLKRILPDSIRRKRPHCLAKLTSPRYPEICVAVVHAAPPNRIRIAGPQPTSVKKNVA